MYDQSTSDGGRITIFLFFRKLRRIFFSYLSPFFVFFFYLVLVEGKELERDSGGEKKDRSVFIPHFFSFEIFL